MTPYFDHSGVTLYCGSSLDVLRQLPEQSVHCVVTSPPYWSLRDYGVTGQLGLEKTPAEYVSKMVEVFREVRRVLRDDGTLWLNIGDTYASNGGPFEPEEWDNKQSTNRGSSERNRRAPDGLKAKDLVGIPWMLAFALRDDGWYLRSDIIWSKANPMPESVTDRPTKSHEYIFLLSKSPNYYYDAEAIKEPSSPNSHARASRGRSESHKLINGAPGQPPHSILAPRLNAKANGPNSRMVREHQPGKENSKPNPSRSNVPGVTPKSAPAGSGIKANESFSAAVVNLVENRNKRSVWTVATAPYRAAHFATFPPTLIRPCILAGCPVGGTVLDPFFGSGTTGMVALELGRKAIGIDLNPEYCALAEERCRVTPGLPL